VPEEAKALSPGAFDAVAIAQQIIACASVTPADAGAQAVLADRLAQLGFTITPLRFGDTENFFARLGTASPHLCFAGHTDVVPPGQGWRHDPFAGVVENGRLYGRGACDMKGAIAAFVAATARHLQAGPPAGSISLLITGDEEGPATDGTVRVLDWMADHGQLPDACIVGEPTNPTRMGEMIKIGRRGSLNATITVPGTQGHVAYPHRAENPIHPLVAALAELASHTLDTGTDRFEPSSLQITSVDVGNRANNVIPAQAVAKLNIRFNDRHTGADLCAWITSVVARHCPRATVASSISGEAFLTTGEFGERLASIVARVAGTRPALDTGGGTSDARFIARHAPVAEFGLVGATMHQVDESVAVADLYLLTDIYTAILQDFLP
jgi:succinyl-diaminopimelate desuccinylase